MTPRQDGWWGTSWGMSPAREVPKKKAQGRCLPWAYRSPFQTSSRESHSPGNCLTVAVARRQNGREQRWGQLLGRHSGVERVQQTASLPIVCWPHFASECRSRATDRDVWLGLMWLQIPGQGKCRDSVCQRPLPSAAASSSGPASNLSAGSVIPNSVS
jgi:hypothetical protein